MSLKTANAITSQSCSTASETSSLAIAWTYCSLFDTRFDSLNSAFDSSLYTLSLWICLLATFGVERVTDLSRGGFALGGGGVGPTVVGGSVRAVQVLLGGSVECVALLVGNSECHDGGSTHIHSFRDYLTVLFDLGVGRSVAVVSSDIGFVPDLLAHSVRCSRSGVPPRKC